MTSDPSASPPQPTDERVRRSLYAATLVVGVLCVAGGLVLMAGTRSASSVLHAEFELFAVFAGLTAFFLASAKYVVSRERAYLPLAIGLLAATLSDLAHLAVAASGRGAGSSEYLWLLGRVALASGFVAAAVAVRGRPLDEHAGARLVTGILLAFGSTSLGTAAVLGLALPEYYGALGSARPLLELLPVPVFGVAAYLLATERRAGLQGLRVVGLATLALSVLVHVVALGSTSAGDTPYFAAHALKVGAYLVVLFGLYLEHARLYSLERGLRESLEGAHAELRAAKLELEAIIEDLTDGVMVADETGRILRINRAGKQILGRDQLASGPDQYAQAYHLETPDGRPFPPEAYPIVRALRSGEPVRNVDLVVRRPGGERRAVVAGAVPLRDPQGRIRGAVAAFHDVTDIRTAEQRFRDLTEGAPDGILVLDDRWRIVLFNDAAERLWGYHRDELFGKDVAQLLPDRFRTIHLAAREQHERTGRPARAEGPVPFRGLRKDGTEIPIEVSMRTSVTALGHYYIAHVRNISERERSRREREGILSVATSSSATTTTDEFLRRAAEAITRATEFDACTVYVHDANRNALVLRAWDRIPDDVRDRIRSYPLDPTFPAIAVQTWFERKVLIESQLPTRTDLPVTPLVGKYHYQTVISAPFGDGKEPWGVLQVVATLGRNPREDDIQLLELLAQELTAGLRQKRLIQELEHSTRELLLANQELDSFIYTASHDLAEPLRSISNFSHFLLEDYAHRLDDEGRDYLGRVHQGALRMKRLLDDLLRLSRHGRTRAPRVRVNIHELLDEVRESLDATLRENHATLDVESELPDVVGDRTSLHEVFINLIGNGVKFNDNPNPRVAVRARRSEGLVEFQIEDNGIGIAPEHHERIFGLFTRLHARKDYAGTGAGLAIVKKIVENHDGRIWVESAAQRGATFHFTVPAAPAPAAKLEVPQAGRPVA